MYIRRRIDSATILVDFEMNVVACGTPAGSHERNDLPFLDNVTHFDQVFFVVGIARGEPFSVVYFHHQSITITLTRPSHDTSGNGDNISAYRSRISL